MMELISKLKKHWFCRVRIGMGIVMKLARNWHGNCTELAMLIPVLITKINLTSEEEPLKSNLIDL